MIQPQFKRKDIRSYVIRTGRMTLGQENALARAWPVYGLDLANGLHALPASFVESHSPLILEIGFGMGDSLLEMATHDPASYYVGIEVHVPGIGRLVNEADRRGVQNLRVFCADAYDVLELCIPPASLDRVQLFFPDPWHKSRHHKRRLVQEPFIDLVVAKLKPSGIFHMATDWTPYAEAALDTLSRNLGLENCSKASDGYSMRPAYRPDTKFERRGKALGHSVHDILFRKRIDR